MTPRYALHWAGRDAPCSVSTMPAPSRPTTYRATSVAGVGGGVRDGGVAAFEFAEKHLRASQDAVLGGQLLGALGSAKDPALAE